ncbi:MAG: coproporphyrinogen dehydrogenase HemZ [Acutalibacteraceae bacterium]|nr:coproporphyrinogen dehydrogenase HemZ [Acutalibacteraceae bacterium]
MKLCCVGHTFRYEMEKLCRLFLPFEKIEVIDEIAEDDSVAVTKLYGNSIYSSLKYGDAFCEKTGVLPENFSDRDAEREIAAILFDCFVQITDYAVKWGIVTGIRPACLYSSVIKELGSEEEAQRFFREKFYVNDEKISLCKETYLAEENIIRMSSPRSFSLYISIPFCPTRCSYCSFVSHAIEKTEKLIPQYVEYLCKEIVYTANIAKELNLRLETIYIGGGTPTTLTACQLERVISIIKTSFDLKYLREFTVEAGRPDTITEDKLCVLKKLGVDRISINPQTMNDEVLKNIGRAHTAMQTIEAFKLARRIGFDNINMDIIAGLPDDNIDSFKNTLLQISELDPESVTVHSLSMKRSSKMNVNGDFPEIEIGKTADEMVMYAREFLTSRGVVPYYMYRQSKTVGNLENVGYSKTGTECLYNVFIMDETHTILGCGASAVTKMREPNGDYIERVFNYKYPYEYINNFDIILQRKNAIKEFYKKYPVEKN